MPKTKREVKSKEQIAFEIRQKEQLQKNKDFVHNKLYPLFLANAETLEEVMKSCEIMGSVITAAMAKHWVGKNMSELALLEDLESGPDLKGKDLYIAIVKLMNDMPIREANEFLKGMAGTIDGYIRRVLIKKPFKEINIKELVNE